VPSLVNKIMAALATRLDVTVPAIRQHVHIRVVDQFGKLQHLGGDTMVASALLKPRDDMHDATFVRVRSITLHVFLLAQLFSKYEAFTDRYARQRREPEYEKNIYFGQLQHIFVVQLPVIVVLKHLKPETLFLAAVRTCDVVASDSLGAQYFSKLQQPEILDMSCIQCVVGRVPIGQLWALIDRSRHVPTSEHE
jgi:hypothetical protein